jgi:hypothetical protein
MAPGLCREALGEPDPLSGRWVAEVLGTLASEAPIGLPDGLQPDRTPLDYSPRKDEFPSRKKFEFHLAVRYKATI